MILLPIKTLTPCQRSCLILKPVINENEIEFCSFQKCIDATNDQLFPLLESLARLGNSRREQLEMANAYTPMCAPDIAEHWQTQQPLKSNSRSSPNSVKGEKKFNFISPPIEESGPRENGSSSKWRPNPPIIPNLTFCSIFPRKDGIELEHFITLARKQTENFEI